MKKNIFISLLIIIAAIVAIIFYLRPESLLKTEKLKIQDLKISYQEKPLKVDVTYPAIDGLDDFNQKAKAIIEKEIADFKKNSLENDEAVKKIDPEAYAKYPREYELLISYKTGQINQNIVSIVFEEYNFEGGAHGATLFIPLNYDVQNKKEIKLADLFSGQDDYLKKISDFCIADLTKQMTASGAIDMTDIGWINEGAGPKEENYSIFLINPKDIIFYFPQYQVAAYAAGDFQVTYPR